MTANTLSLQVDSCQVVKAHSPSDSVLIAIQWARKYYNSSKRQELCLYPHKHRKL